MYPDMDTLRDKLRKRREELGLSMAELAKEAGLSAGYINNVEKGERKPTDDALVKLAPALGFKAEELLAWADAERLGDERLTALKEYVLPSKWLRPGSLIEQVDDLANDKDLSLRELAFVALISYDRLFRALRGQLTLSPEEVLRVAVALDVPIDLLETALEVRRNELTSARERIASSPEAQLVFDAIRRKFHRSDEEGHEGGYQVPDDLEDPLEDWEWGVLQRTGAVDDQGYSEHTVFWHRPKQERQALIRSLDRVWSEYQARLTAPQHQTMTTLSGGLDIPDDIEEPLDEWELEVLHRTGAAHAHDYGPQSDFWYLPKEERRAILENLDEIWRENVALMKKMRKRG